MATIAENPGASTRPANQNASTRDTIGIAYPFRKQDGEFPKKVVNVEAVKSDLITLFDTPLRSRVMKPNFGSNKEELVFESTGPLLRARLIRNIRQTIFLNEPRVVVLAVQITEEKTLVTATILYAVQGVRDTLTLEIERPAA
jgi:phage baseplate assembly protein W